MRIVIDTNVLIASFYEPHQGPSFSKDVYDYAVQTETVILSPAILDEFREKCTKELKLPRTLINKLLIQLHRRTEIVSPPASAFENIPKTLRDPKDRHVLALTFNVKADLLLTWDKDLLVLEKVGNTRIVTPRQFWDEKE